MVDLRGRVHELDRIPPLTGRFYLGALLAILFAGLVDLGVRGYELAVPTTPPFEIAIGDRTAVFTTSASHAPVRSGEELISLDGVPLAAGATLSAVHRRLAGLARARTVEAVVRDPGSGAERTVTLALGRDEPSDFAFNFFLSGWLLLGAVLGLLVLRAREGSGAVRRYVELTLATLLPVCVLAPFTWWDTVAIPWTGAIEEYLSPAELAALPTGLAWPFLVGWFLIRFLHVFPSPSDELRADFPLPAFSRLWRWILWPLAAVMLATTAGLAAGLDVQLVGWGFVPAFVIAFLVAILLLPTWLWKATLTAFRLARRRLDTAAPAEVAQVRLALQGVRLGALLFALMGVVAVVAIVLSIADADLSGIEHLLAVLFAMALVAPFLGMALAILRGGLWDVDLIVRRGTLLTALGALFVGAWLGFEILLDALVPEGILGLGPALAAVAVAVAGRPLTLALSRRFFPSAVAFPAIVERLSARLAGAASDHPASRIGLLLAEDLELDRCAVAPPEGPVEVASPSLSPAFQHPAGWDASPVITGAAPLLCPDVPAVIVRTDEGPVLVLGLGPEPASGPRVAVGMRGGGYFYGPDEIRLLRVLLNPLAEQLGR